jgi:hypothetical protein
MSEAMDPLTPFERVSVLYHWLKGLDQVPGSALDGVQMAGRVAGRGGEDEIAPAWISDWEKAGCPDHGLTRPEDGKSASKSEELAVAEKKFGEQIDAFDDLVRAKGLTSTPDSDFLMGQWWELFDRSPSDASKTLELLTWLLTHAPKGSGRKKRE